MFPRHWQLMGHEQIVVLKLSQNPPRPPKGLRSHESLLKRIDDVNVAYRTVSDIFQDLVQNA